MNIVTTFRFLSAIGVSAISLCAIAACDREKNADPALPKSDPSISATPWIDPSPTATATNDSLNPPSAPKPGNPTP